MPGTSSVREKLGSAQGRLYSIIVLFVLIGLMQYAIGRWQAKVLHAVRSYVAGEGQWSKAQKNGMQNLLRYGATSEEVHYREFLREIAVPLGDKKARLELLKDDPDLGVARQGFLEGGNHPDDVDSLIWLFRNYGTLPPMANAIRIWTEGDLEIDRTCTLAEKLHESIATGKPTASTRAMLAELERTNIRLTTLENQFSETLGEASRWVGRISGRAIFFATILLFGSGAWLAWRVIRGHREASEVVAESERKFRSAFDNAATGMGIVAVDGRVLQANRTMCEMLGYREDELLQLSSTDLTHPDDVAEDRALVQAMLDGASDHYIREKRYLRKDGIVIFSVVSVALVRGPGRKPLYLIGQVNDITARVSAERELKKAHAEQKAILENAIVGITLVRRGCIAWANRRFGALVGTVPNRLIGRAFDSFFAIPQPELMEKADAVLKSGKSFEGEVAFRRAEGSPIWCRIAGKAIDPADMEQGSIWLVDDVTEQKLAQIALIEAKEKAENATRLKDKFVSLVSHDLRGPLGAITGFLSLALEGGNNRFDDETRSFLQEALTTSRRMVQFTRELLDMSRLSTGKIKPEKAFFNAARFVAKITGGLAATADQKEIRLVGNIPSSCRLYADPTLFTEVLVNILSNAMKFTGKGGTVSVGMIEDGGNGLVVKDTGTGIPQDRLEHLFSFEHKTSTPGLDGESGSGLGLPLCKDIMTAHGGNLTIASAPGAGTSVYLSFPAVQPRVLLIGASASLAANLEQILRPESIALLQANTGREALEMLATTPVHLFAIRADDETGDGREALDILRAAPESRQTPVIVLTTGGKRGAKEKEFQEIQVEGQVDIIEELSDFVPCVRRFLG